LQNSHRNPLTFQIREQYVAATKPKNWRLTEGGGQR
jgi:hypothetical protein